MDALAALVALAGLVALAAQEHEPAASYEESPVGHERNRRMGAVAGAAGALGHEGAAEALTGQASRAALAALAAAPATVRRDPKTSLLHLASTQVLIRLSNHESGAESPREINSCN